MGTGKLVELSTRSTLSMFPALNDKQNAFSRSRHRIHQATVQPSIAFWQWLALSEQAWQMRGEVKLENEELSEILGKDLIEAVAAGSLSITTASLWAGAGGTRTPLHT